MTSPSPDGRPRSVYVHVPFCFHRCHYCDFSVSATRRPPVGAYLEALEADLDRWFTERGWDGRLAIDTLFVGGGTPSLLGAEGMRGLGRRLAERFDWDPSTIEWTAESNPVSLTRAVCEAWREIGINRLSVGVQSFQDGPLDWLGRRHDGRQAENAVRRARQAGFDRVNVDLIFGLPESVRRDWRADVARAVDVGATHVSAYGLTAEPRTPLGRHVTLGRVRMPDEERYGREYLEVAELLRDAGYEHYEVSSFARPGHVSRHNWHYWDGSEYLGVGPSAHSHLAGERIWNVYRWDRYRAALSAGETVRQGSERLRGDQRRLERIWLGLRTRAGVPWSIVGAEGHEDVLAAWSRTGWTMPDDESLRLTPEGWLRLDLLASEVARWRTETSGQPRGMAI